MEALGKYLVLLLCINFMFFVGNIGLKEVSGMAGIDNTITLIHCKGTVFESADVAKCENETYTVIDVENASNKLPSGSSIVSPTSGEAYTDVWSSIKNWFADKTGYNYFTAFVGALPNFLNSVGVDSNLVFAIGAIWYLIGLFLIIAFIAGRVF